MKHRELTNHIKGSFLKRQFLEAFLVQSAYIESLLKLFADYSFFNAAQDKAFSDKVLVAARKNIEKFGMNDLVKFLHDAGLVSKEQKKLLNTYRERRNRMMHDLIKEIAKDGFEAELKEICEKGNEIIESAEIIKIADLIDYMELPDKTETVSDAPVQEQPPLLNGKKGVNSA